MFFFKKYFNAATILTGIGLSCMLAFFNTASARAADFNHIHNDSCYGYVTEYCTNHGMSSVCSNSTAYCAACGREQPMYERNVYEWCANGCDPLGDEPAGHYLQCAACGYEVETRYEEFHYHYYDVRKLLCTHSAGEKMASLSVSAYPTVWTNGAVTLNASVATVASDFRLAGNAYNFGAGYQSGASCTVSANGTYSVSVIDSNGNVATEKITVSNIDVTKPVISLAKSTGEWTSSGLKISVTASDVESGLPSRAYSYNGGEYVSSADYYVGENGTIKVSVRDNAGNISTATITVSNIDNGAPTVKLTRSTDSWVKEGLTVTATASDAVSGLADNAYSFNGGAYSAVNTLYVTSNGKVSVDVKDKAGNVSNATIEVNNIDNSAPTLSLSPEISEWTNRDVKILMAAADHESGLPDAPYSVDGGEYSKDASFTASSNGTYTVTALDNVGNSVTQSITISNIDKTAPALKLSLDKTAWTNTPVTVTAKASDGESGIAANGYSFNDGTYADAVSFLAAANTTVKVSVKDNAGNVTSDTISISNIDTVLPKVEISRDTTEWVNGDVHLTVTAGDGESGLAENAYSLNAGVYGKSNVFTISENGTYKISVTDKAGNVSTKTVSIGNIDKEAPTVLLSKNTEEWTEEGVTVSVKASDGVSGLADKAYSYNGGRYTDETSYKLKKNGTLTVSVKDKAGNVNTQSIEVANIGKDPAKAAEEKSALEKLEAKAQELRDALFKSEAEKKAAEEAKAAAEAEKKAAEEAKAAAEKKAAEEAKAAAEKKAAEEAKAAAEKKAAEEAKKAAEAKENEAETPAHDETISAKNDSVPAVNTQTPDVEKNDAGGLKSGTGASKNSEKQSADIDTVKDTEGNLIPVNDMTRKAVESEDDEPSDDIIPVADAENTGSTAGEAELTIEIIAPETSGDMIDISREQNIDNGALEIKQASVGNTLFKAGIALLALTCLMLSFFNYTFATENGRVKFLTRIRVQKSGDSYIVIIPAQKLKEHGRYNLYLSLWNRARVKNHKVYVKLSGQTSEILTDRGRSFKI